MKKLLVIIFLIQLGLSAQNRPLTIDDLWAMERITSFDVSSDGKIIAFTSTNYSMDLNKGNSNIYLINSDGKNIRSLKDSEKNEKDPKFSPDGKTIAYLFESQIWTTDLNGKNDKQLTSIYTGVDKYVWLDDGSKLLFTSKVYPDCTNDECNKEKDEAKNKSEVKASIFTELMYRHWDNWRGEKRSHLFLFDINKNEYIDLNLMSPNDVPPISLGSTKDFSFSPEGKEAAYAINTSEMLATSTDNNIVTVELENLKKGYKIPAKKISDSEGNDNQPVYSPDGNYIAFTSMERAGFEADKKRLMLYNRSTESLKYLTKNSDISISEIIWSPDSKTIYFNAYNQIYRSIYKIDIDDPDIKIILEQTVSSDLNISDDGKTIYFKHQSSDLPYEIFTMNADGSNMRQITFVNQERLANIEMNPVDTFWSPGAEDAKVQSILIKPPNFDPKKKYPMIFLIHGGPQGAWTDDFHFRWNMQLFAAQGYVVVAPNPRGSVGYGQKFTDEISGDWGGKVYIDLMNAYDYAIDNYSFIDPNNTFAAGASYGGYMINWIAGHNDKFNALVSHAGVFNLESMYGTTEELWFAEWEFGGAVWENRELYRKWSPHLYIDNATTPMLIIHGAFDFRVGEGQAMELFTSLQRLGVESKFLYFPDESHWISKPQNAKLWWNTIFDWFDKHHKTELQ
jgi:dipeptidyl aminopeptidase/acylaminoacyl peptidase